MSHIEVNLTDLPLDQPVRIEHPPVGIVVVRRADGVSAFYDSCPHAQWRLSDGYLNGSLLECPGHGWQFEVSTGECLEVPAYCLKALKVSECGDVLRIELESGSEQRELNESEALV